MTSSNVLSLKAYRTQGRILGRPLCDAPDWHRAKYTPRPCLDKNKWRPNRVYLVWCHNKGALWLLVTDQMIFDWMQCANCFIMLEIDNFFFNIPVCLSCEEHVQFLICFLRNLDEIMIFFGVIFSLNMWHDPGNF